MAPTRTVGSVPCTDLFLMLYLCAELDSRFRNASSGRVVLEIMKQLCILCRKLRVIVLISVFRDPWLASLGGGPYKVSTPKLTELL